MSKPSKHLLFVLLLLNTAIACFSQQAATDKYKFSLAPASPEAAMLFKFSEVPVSKYTGTPNIAIPIKKVQSSNNFGLDISLSYHASGNKVSEIPSFVGLGWSLNAGGMIARKTRGLPDDADVGQAFLKLRQNYTYNDLLAVNEANYTNLSSGCWDAEPDEFFFNFNGYSGSFSFDWSTTTNLVVSSSSPVKITYFQEIANSNAITKWQIVSPDGYQYTFSSLEQTVNKSAYTGLGSCKVTTPYTTSWYLTQIINLNNTSEHIDFTYQSYTLDYDWVYIESKSFGNGGCGCSSASGGTTSVTPNRTYVSGLRLNQIKFYPSNITADFIALNDRQDLVSTYQGFNTNNKTLDEIKISYNGGQNPERYAFSYFYQGNRLMLQKIQQVTTDKTEKRFEFIYNSTTLPARDSKSIDSWGYYNGKSNNTLLPSYINQLSTTPYYFRGSDRTPDETYAKAQLLEKIIYPTGGSTEFVYEGHVYGYVQNATVSSLGQFETADVSRNAETIGNGSTYSWVSNTLDFHINALQGSPNPVEIQIISSSYSCMTQGDGSYFCYGGAYLPRATIYKFNTVTSQYEQIYSYTHPPSGPGSINNVVQQVIYTPGDYRVIVQANRTANNPTGVYDNINVSLNWRETDFTKPVVQKKAGGLRVKEIRYRDGISSTQKVTKFLYTSGTQNIATGVINGEPVYVDGGVLNTNCGSQVGVQCPFNTIVGSGNIVFGETNGSHIGYREVTAYETGNGKTVTRFLSSYDYPDNVNLQKPYGNPASNAYKTGLVYDESSYNESGTLVAQQLNEYDFRQLYINALKRSRGQITCYQAPPGGAIVTDCPFDPVNYSSYYATWSVPMQLGFAQLKKQSSFQDGAWVEKNFTYDTNLQLLKQEVFNNKNIAGNTLTTDYKYPGDESQMSGLSASETSAINVLKTQNRIVAVLEKTIKRDDAVLSQTRNNFNTFVNGQTNLESISESIKSWPLEKKLQVNAYDGFGNIVCQNKVNDLPYAYIWGYSGLYVVAQVVNADPKNIFYTSFEEGDGNSTTGDSKTGNKSKTDGFTISLSNLANGAYTFSYWQKSGGNWVLQKSSVTVTAGAYTISLAGQVDEIRFYPEKGLMTTYAYAPLIGIISQCDANDRVTYYQYDGFNRLVLVKDQDNNIIKKICYNYAGQPGDCSSTCVNSNPYWQNTTTALRCQQGSCGYTGYQEQEQKDMNPCSSTYNQARWVQAGYNPGTCAAGATATLTYNNLTSLTGFTAAYINTTTGQTYNFTIPVNAGTLGCVPVGTYNITISKYANKTMLVFGTGCTAVSAVRITFYNVNVTATACNSITMDYYNQ